MSSEQVEATAAPEGPSVAEPAARRRTLRNLGLVVVAVIALDILALLFVPPFPRGGQPGDACTFPVCYINGTLEFPPPHVVFDLDPGNPMPTGSAVVTFHPSITSTILTMWIIMAILIVLGSHGDARHAAGTPVAPEPDRVRLRDRSRTSAWVSAARAGPAVHPAVRRVLPAHPVLQLERPHPAHRQDRGPARAHERPERHDRPRPGRVRLLRVPGLPAPRRRRLPGQVLPVLRVPEGHRGRASSPCSSA